MFAYVIKFSFLLKKLILGFSIQEHSSSTFTQTLQANILELKVSTNNERYNHF